MATSWLSPPVRGDSLLDADATLPAWANRRQNQILWAFIVIGLLARCVRYLAVFPLWEDECFLCVNLVDRGYGDMFRALEYGQVAPVLFLWIELTLVKLFGFNELSLRLFAFICSVASLFLFRHVAVRLLRGTSLLVAVGVFAVAYPGIRYAAEAKQYGSDMFVGLCLLAIAVEWWTATKAQQSSRGLWALVAVVPFAIALSFPGIFAAGGVSLFVAFILLQRAREQERSGVPFLHAVVRDRDWLTWGLFNFLLAGSFLLVLSWAAKNQNVTDMDQYWGDIYPPLATPWKLPLWLLNVHAGDLLAYPVGGGRGASALTYIAVAVAIVGLFRKRLGAQLVLFLASPLLHLVAASLQRYPYGGHVKFSQHMAAIICLLAGIGTASILAWCTRRRLFADRAVATVFAFLLCVGLVSTDLIEPTTLCIPRNVPTRLISMIFLKSATVVVSMGVG